MQQYPNNAYIRSNFHRLRKEYNKSLKLARQKFVNDLVAKLDTLHENNPKLFWETIDKLKNNTVKTNPISISDWHKYMKDLYAADKHENPNFIPTAQDFSDTGPLDFPFTCGEFQIQIIPHMKLMNVQDLSQHGISIQDDLTAQNLFSLCKYVVVGDSSISFIDRELLYLLEPSVWSQFVQHSDIYLGRLSHGQLYDVFEQSHQKFIVFMEYISYCHFGTLKILLAHFAVSEQIARKKKLLKTVKPLDRQISQCRILLSFDWNSTANALVKKLYCVGL
ncbi:unnamed protein product [Mytilus edulis]|uniref:Uncharacterized protein n=1 Tax=Mytilus edulis TaxID=6550 RepID=A0A8S3RIV5_MYTED|nr:unnamed protein product [Mytilus edulis]